MALVPSTAPGDWAPPSPWTAASFLVNHAAYTETATILISMIVATMNDLTGSMADFRGESVMRLSQSGWQRWSASLHRVDVDSDIPTYAGVPDLYVLPSSRIGVFTFRGSRSAEFKRYDLCGSEATFGWHPPWDEEYDSGFCAQQTPSLDYLHSAKSTIEAAMDVHSRAGIKHFYITGHSLGGAVGLLAASQMSPPLPALVFAPGGWRTALLNCTRGRAVGGSALSGYGNSTFGRSW